MIIYKVLSLLRLSTHFGHCFWRIVDMLLISYTMTNNPCFQSLFYPTRHEQIILYEIK